MDIKTSHTPVPYEAALSEMEARVEGIHAGEAQELLWLLEHPSLYTAGTSAKEEDLLNPQFPVYQTGRGGQYTYHGPGQRVGYVIMDLKKRQSVPDIKKYVWQLEEWIIQTLGEFGVKGARREGRVGIWVIPPKGSEAKIAAIGVRIRHWVSYHGISINIDPDLSHYEGIIPCGISEHGVTSLKALGIDVTTEQFDGALINNWDKVFDALEKVA